jgi:hypothetical protein
MMQQFQILDQADQQFGSIINNRRITLRLRYNVTIDRWSFDLSVDDKPVIHGRRIVTGIDLLKPFNLGLGMIFALSHDVTAVPDRKSLPLSIVKLFHASEEELLEA